MRINIQVASMVKFNPKPAMAYFVMLLLSIFSAKGFAELDTTTQTPPTEFSHVATGFPLIGAHQMLECPACHVGGIFKGTPRICSECHSKGKRIIATVMPTNHVSTNDPCDTCHTNSVSFLGAHYNHSKSSPSSCPGCHNGQIATGKSSNHVAALQLTESCGRCHRTYAWMPALFDHTGVTLGACATQCHNGLSATGRPASHNSNLKSTSSCDTCHRFSAWQPTFYNHTAVTPGSCANCHNGAVATAKPSDHTGSKSVITCDKCHSTIAWLPASYNHAGVISGSCATCHGAQRPTSHAARGYSGTCDRCHSIAATWTFNHALQQGQHTCNMCHSHHNNSTPCDYCHSVNGW